MQYTTTTTAKRITLHNLHSKSFQELKGSPNFFSRHFCSNFIFFNTPLKDPKCFYFILNLKKILSENLFMLKCAEKTSTNTSSIKFYWIAISFLVLQIKNTSYLLSFIFASLYFDSYEPFFYAQIAEIKILWKQHLD